MLYPDARISTTHETEEPVPLQGTLDRLVLRPEQTGWAILYIALPLDIGDSHPPEGFSPNVDMKD